jgi:WD40 repeat protein
VERGELRAALRGHTQIVLSATFSPDGARIATSAQDGLVLVWDAATGAEVLRFADHEGWVSALAFSPDGRRIMSVGFDATARLHSVAATHARPPAHGPAGPVSGVAYSPDGALVATADWEGAVRLWDAVDGSERAVLEGHEGSISRLVFDSTGSRLASAGHDGTARLWDVASQTQVAVFQSGGAALFDARISPDGARLATAGANGEVVLWDIAGGGRLATVTRGVLPMALAFDRLGARLAAGWADGGILLYDGVTLAPRQVLASTEGALCALDFSADGRALASAGFDQPLRVYDLAAGTARVLYEVPGTGFVSAVAFAPGDGRIAWTSNGGQIWVRDLTSALTRTWDAHTREINALAWSPDGAWIASASDDGTVGLDEAATGLPRWFATGLSERPEGAWTHRGWQGLGEEGTPAGSTAWEKAVEGARRAAASSDGGRVCLQEPGGQVALWDARLDRALGRWEASPLADLFALPDACVGRSREGQVRAFAADAAPRTLATAASALAIEGPVALIADAEGARGIDRHGEEHVRVAATPGATAILRIGDTWLLGYPDGRFERFAPGATDPAATRLDAAPASAIRRLAAGPNGDVLVGFDSGDLGLWRIEDGHRLLRGKLHGPITHLARRSGPVLALSERGDVASLDVREFTQGWCEVLHDVWAQVPEVWEGGRVQTRGAGGHRCAGE